MPKISESQETRRGSPVDARPSTNKLHHFVQKKRRKKMWHPGSKKKNVTSPAPLGLSKINKYMINILVFFQKSPSSHPRFRIHGITVSVTYTGGGAGQHILFPILEEEKKTFRIEQMGQMCTSLK